jgi:hypothetical protein
MNGPAAAGGDELRHAASHITHSLWGRVQPRLAPFRRSPSENSASPLAAVSVSSSCACAREGRGREVGRAPSDLREKAARERGAPLSAVCRAKGAEGAVRWGGEGREGTGCARGPGKPM